MEWEVNEITIEDKYEIVLNITYETDVPSAVVVMEPGSVALPEMKAGDVYNGELTLTNHGLVRADNLSFRLPEDGVHFDYELLAGLPESLGAKERITVPFRVSCLQSLEPDGQSGGGCGTYYNCLGVGYSYVCANGGESSGSAQSCFTATYGDCSGRACVGPDKGAQVRKSGTTVNIQITQVFSW